MCRKAVNQSIVLCPAPGEIQNKGMVLPFSQDIYRPMLKRLEAEGLVARETSTVNRIAPVVEDEAVRY